MRFCAFLIQIYFLFFVFLSSQLRATEIKKTVKTDYLQFYTENVFHVDSIHKLNFRYTDKPRGIRPFVTPAILISAGTAIHFSTETKTNLNRYVQKNFAYQGHIDDYLQYAPVVAVYGLNAIGVNGKNNFGNRTALAAKSFLLMDLVVNNLKNWTKTERPNGSMRSFPSGHTAFSFSMAHFMHKEYGEKSVWYSVGAYSCATTVGLMRVAKNAHWLSDVLAGAGIGILSTEFVYLTHLYKWDKHHVKNFDIFPFQTGKQKGISMVYRF